jgi:hypothetical protein
VDGRWWWTSRYLLPWRVHRWLPGRSDADIRRVDDEIPYSKKDIDTEEFELYQIKNEIIISGATRE